MLNQILNNLVRLIKEINQNLSDMMTVMEAELKTILPGCLTVCYEEYDAYTLRF